MLILLYPISWCWLWCFPLERRWCTAWDGLLPSAKSRCHTLSKKQITKIPTTKQPTITTTTNSKKPKSITDKEWKTCQIKQVQVQTRTHIYIWILFSLHFSYVELPRDNDSINEYLFQELWESNSKILNHLNYEIDQLYSNTLQYTTSMDSRRERDICNASFFYVLNLGKFLLIMC